MNAHSAVDRSHPHFVAIPDPQSSGVRAYAEPETPRSLQITFLDAERERAWVEEIRSLLSAGNAAEADRRLTAELEGFNGSLARLCRAVTAESVTLEGFDDLLPVLDEWEGPPITAITLGLTNPADLVFEPGRAHEPELLLGLYSDEAFAFSRSSRADLLAECARETPAWIGSDEDVEFRCAIPALAELNSALIHCKHRHYLRDGRDGVEGRAPGGYVEYVLGCWLLATRFLQAAERAVAEHGLPPGCRLIAGAVDINADFVCVLGKERPARAAAAIASAPQANFATLTVKPWVPREDPTAEAATQASTLRQRLVTNAPAPPAPAVRGSFLARFFGRLPRG